jgi:xylulose-5-phosphate/fructose-6-phosphate phosphoketolase
MSANPHANGGRLTVDLDLPDFHDYAVEVTDQTRATSVWSRPVSSVVHA